ncbi:MAG: tetratricopeptide repeat protein [Pseudomonadota bacterium]
MRKPFALLAACALASCSSQEAESTRSAINGGGTFLELVEDARVAMREGDLAAAGRFYDEARALEPENPGLWVDIARLRFRGGEHLIAIEAADYALELDPQYPPALLLRAQMVRDANGLAESLPWFEAAAEADPSNPDALAEYAATLGDLGRYGAMLEVVRKLAEVSPDHPQVHYLQAVLAARGQDPLLAGSLLQRSGLVERGVPAAMMLDAIIDIQQGSFDSAAERLETLAKRQPANVRVNELLARALWLGGRDEVLVEKFAARADTEGASSYLTMLVGRSFERMGERSRAIPYITRALAEQDDGVTVLPGSSQGSGAMPAATAELRDFVGSGNRGPARSLANTLLARAPFSGDFHALAADAALANGETARALELYEVAARVRRSWPMTRKLIHALDESGDVISADVLLSRTIAGDPQNTEALLLLAERSAQREDWLRAVVLLDTAIGMGAGNDLDVLELRADAARSLGREDEAKRFDALIRSLRPGAFLDR